MPTRGRFVCHVHCLVHYGAVRSSLCGPHHENFGRNLYHMFVSAYFGSQSLFCFDCGIRVASKSSVDSIPFLSGVLMFLCDTNPSWSSSLSSQFLFNRRVSLQVDPIISTSARSPLGFPNDVCFIRHKLPLFSHPPTLFFKDSYFLIKYHFIDVMPLHSFLSMFVSSDSHEDTNGASSSSFFVLFLLRWIQFKPVWSCLFPRFKYLLLPVQPPF